MISPWHAWLDERIYGRHVEAFGATTVASAQGQLVTHLFTGRYVVTDAARKKLTGTDGFFQVGLALDDGASGFG